MTQIFHFVIIPETYFANATIVRIDGAPGAAGSTEASATYMPITSVSRFLYNRKSIGNVFNPVAVLIRAFV